MTNDLRDAPILDVGVVDELRESTGGDDDFVRDLIATYIEEGAAMLDGMADAARGADAPAMVRPAHTLKSSSASIGALRLAAICRELEAAGREGRTDGFVDLTDLVRSTWDETLTTLRAAGLAP
jgi:HPt (histidine-containing phosphotransfer) domain-containing protein